MQTLKLSKNDELTDAEMLDARVPMRFWKRQFFLEPTSRQWRFDWAFGVVLPTICVAADPIVFSSFLGEGDALLARYKIFAYLLSSVSIMAMAAWLLWGQRLGGLRPILGGLFMAGSAISLIVGLILLPFSLIGMLLLIGFLGFTPLFSSFVYLRNSVRAINGAKTVTPAWEVHQAVILAALYSLVVPFVLNF